MTQPLISVLHPTARVRPYLPGFPYGWRDAMEQWFKTCADPSRVEYVVSVHASRWEQFQHGRLGLECPAWGSVRFVRNDGRDDNVTQANCAAAASRGHLLMGTMDDLFAPQDWDRLMLEALQSAGSLGEWVLHCSSGSLRDWEPLINAGGMTRARYERFGYLVYPEYESMYVDNDFTEVAYREGQVIRCPEIEFEHRHPSFGKGVKDEIYALQNRTEAYRNGRRIFERRRIQGFPAEYKPEGEPAPLVNTQPRGSLDHPASLMLAVALPGEQFSGTWVAHWSALLPDLLRTFAGVFPVFAESSNVYAVRHDLAEAMIETMMPRPDLILWIDDDNLVQLPHVLALLESLYKNPDAALAAGWCYTIANVYQDRSPGVSCGLIGADGRCKQSAASDLQAADTDAVERDYTGFPVVLMRTDALEKAGKKAFRPILDDRFERGFSGEDVACCAAMREAGFKILVDRRVKVAHLKLGSPEPAPALVPSELQPAEV